MEIQVKKQGQKRIKLQKNWQVQLIQLQVLISKRFWVQVVLWI